MNPKHNHIMQFKKIITVLTRVSTSSNGISGHNIDVTATCNRCDGEVFICEGFSYNMCSCDSNTPSEIGRNPTESGKRLFYMCENVSIIEKIL